MQRAGFPVGRLEIIQKANTILEAMNNAPQLRTSRTVGSGWYRRFNERYPILSIRTAQAIQRNRNEINEAKVYLFYQTMLKLVIENNMNTSRIFNMDETSFLSKTSSKKVVAVKESRNVWCRKEDPGFHLTIVACVRADGLTIPPLFIVPGVGLNWDILDECVVPNSKVTTAERDSSIVKFLKSGCCTLTV
jgi:hypothetical protein